MKALALGGRQVPVDRRAQDRVGEAHGPAGLEDPGGPSDAIAASRSAPVSAASRPASPSCAPSPRTLTARASAAAGADWRDSRSSTVLATRAGRARPGRSRRRSGAGRTPPPRPAAHRAGTGLPPVTSKQAATKCAWGSAPSRSVTRARTAAGVSGEGRSSWVAGSAASVADTGRPRHPALPLLHRGVGQQSLEQLARDVVREPLLEFGGPSAQRPEAELAGPAAGVLEQP